MTRYDVIANRWVYNVLSGHTKKPLRTERVFPDGDSIYSYGYHFELARVLRDTKGNPTGFLLNGDQFRLWNGKVSSSTRHHQNTVRAAVSRTDLPVVIIPHSALNAAGIEDIEIIDVLPDREVTTSRTYTEPLPRWRWRDVDEIVYRDQTPEEQEQSIRDQYDADLDVWQRWNQGPEPQRRSFDQLDYWRRRPVPVVVNTERRLFTADGWRANEVTINIADDGTTTYTVTTTRHVLGESLIRGTMQYEVTVKCISCGGTGARPWAGLSETYLGYSNEMCPDCIRGRVRETRSRRALFLSGFDPNEPSVSYFFCELASKTPRTVQEAYESLVPDTVKLAQQMGRQVERQGDIFAVPVTLTKRELTKMGATHQRMGRILNTNHAASDVAYLPDGRTFVRGILHHVPEDRDPDHVRVYLPKNTWHLVLKNTVPIAA